jgi:hypothetical protein
MAAALPPHGAQPALTVGTDALNLIRMVRFMPDITCDALIDSELGCVRSRFSWILILGLDERFGDFASSQNSGQFHLVYWASL